MSSASQVPGVEIRRDWREGCEQVALADDAGHLTLPAYERLA